MQSIAAAAGVAKATLYNHFRTKDDVARGAAGRRARPADRAGRALPPDQALAALSDELGGTRCCAGWPRPSPDVLAGLLAVDADRWARAHAPAWPRRCGSTPTARTWRPAGCSGWSLQPGRSIDAAPARRPAGRGALAGPTAAQPSDRVSTTRSAPGPAWSRDRWARPPARCGTPGRPRCPGRVTACTDARAGAHRQLVEPPAQPPAQRRPPLGPAARRAGGGRPAGRRSRRRAGSPRPRRRRRMRERAEAAELVEPHRVVQRAGVGVPEPVVRVEQPRAHRGRRQLGEPDEAHVPRSVTGRPARRRAPRGWAGRRRPGCS